MSKEWYRFDRLKGRITLAGFARLAADAVLINLSVLAALVIRFAYFTAFQAKTFIDFRTEFWFYLRTYTNGAWLLTLISIAIFTLSGFYTYGRFYRGRYKILIVIQAVAVSYLIFGLVIYFINGARFEPKINKDTFFIYIPRAAFLISWLLSTLFLVAARVWSALWRNIIRAERAKQVRPEEIKIRTVLVIGGAGYIGSALLPRLLDKGYHVVLLDLLLYGTEPIQDCLGHPHLTVVQADFRQIDKVVEVMRNVDAVIHLGGIVGDPACALDSDLTTEINLISTRMIAEVAKGSGVGRF
ncbi:MAG: NAD-dependent epimerase/dehydratase family protein, partial [Omnitrophica WOR_2 bacterium]